MTARTISRLFDHALRDTGLTGTQFTLLVETGVGEYPTMAALGEALAIDRSTLSRNFKPLFEAGLVMRQAGQTGRAISLRLTEAGQKKLKEAVPLWEKAQSKIEGALGQESLTHGRHFLRELQNAAEFS